MKNLWNNNNKSEELKKEKELETKSNDFFQDYEFIAVNAATGDQFRKVASLHSTTGSVTAEQVKKFHDESTKEAREWRKNNPGKSVAFRTLQDKNGKQVIKSLPVGELIFPSQYRAKVYDQNGNLIVDEEDIRKEIEKRELEWEQWEREGKLEVVNHEIHHTDDGSSVSVLSRVPPVKRLHSNEINDETTWLPTGSKKIKSIESSQQSESKTVEGSSESESKAKEENIEGGSIVEKIKKNKNEWNVKKIDVTLSNGVQAKHNFLVHNSAKVNINELGTLVYPTEMFTDDERKELSEVLNDSLFINFSSSGKSKEEVLNSYNSLSSSVSASSNLSNKPQQGRTSLIVVSILVVISALAIGGIALMKSKLGKIKKK